MTLEEWYEREIVVESWRLHRDRKTGKVVRMERVDE